MITITLPETEPQIKILSNKRVRLPPDDLTQHDSGPDVQPHLAHSPGSIVFRLNVHGIVAVELITDLSDEEDSLRQRLKTARPVLELLQRLFTVEQPSRIQ